MKYAHLIKLTVLSHENENSQSILDAFLMFFPFNLKDNKPWYKHAVKIHGPVNLHNAAINISDLRAGATLVLAALAARGGSIIFGVEHLDRGYENFDKRLKTLGGNVERIRE